MGLPKNVLGCLIAGVMGVMLVGCSSSSRRMGKLDVEGSDVQWTEEKERVPVHSWHKERVENIRRQKEWADLLLRFVEAAYLDVNLTLETD